MFLEKIMDELPVRKGKNGFSGRKMTLKSDLKDQKEPL